MLTLYSSLLSSMMRFTVSADHDFLHASTQRSVTLALILYTLTSLRSPASTSPRFSLCSSTPPSGPAFEAADTDEMLARASAAIEDFAGGTQLGVSLASLRTQHARRLVGRRTVVLVITDGLDTGEPDDLDRELAWLRRRSRRLLWLNPLLRFEGYAPLARGASVLHRHAHGMLAVHNLSRLEELAASLAALMKS